MSVINQVIATTEKKLKEKKEKLKKAIDFNPFPEAIAIDEATLKLFNTPVTDYKAYEKELRILKDRTAKNKRDVNRVLKPNYSENLYKKLREVETELEHLDMFKFYVATVIN